VPTSLASLLSSLDVVKQSIASLPYCAEGASASLSAIQVFLMFYFVLLRGGSPQTRGNLRVTIRSQLPMSAGLGSSAAYTSSLSTGFVWLALRLQKQHQAADARSDSSSYLGEQCLCSQDETAYTIPRTAGAAALPSVPTFQPCLHLKKVINIWAYQGDNTCAVYGQQPAFITSLLVAFFLFEFFSLAWPLSFRPLSDE
jgi:hypothetical protein